MGHSEIRMVASKTVSTPVVLIGCVGSTPTLPTNAVQIGSLTEIVVKSCAGFNSHVTHCKGLGGGHFLLWVLVHFVPWQIFKLIL